MTDAAAQPGAATEADPATTALSVVAALAAEIETKRNAMLLATITNRPKQNSWASQVSACNRQNVYSILNWEDRKLHDIRLAARFKAGNDQERIILRELNELGFDVVEGQATLPTDMTAAYRVSGRIDGKLRYMGHRIPFEVKSCHPRIFAKLERMSNADALAFISADRYISSHLKQFSLYLFGHNEEAGLLLYTDCMGHWKLVTVTLNYALAESVLDQLDLVKRYVEAKELPDRIPYDEDLCGGCSFLHICLPDVVRAETQLVDDPATVVALDRRAQLSAPADEYEELDKALKEKYRGTTRKILGGKWVVESKEVLVKGKPQWRTTFKVLDQQETAEAADAQQG